MVMSLMSNPKGSVATIIVAADGSGDTTDIQTGINMLPPIGGVIYIREGTYTITTTITIPNNGIEIIGAGASTRIETTENINMIEAINVDYISIHLLYIYGSGLPANNGIYFNTVTNSIITYCWIENCNNGIRCRVSDEINIEGNKCFANNRPGIQVDGGYYIISKNWCYDNVGVSGMDISASGVIEGNLCYDNGNHGIHVNGDDIVILNNICHDNSNAGIYIVGALASPHYNDIVIGNRCYDNVNYEIEITTYSYDAIVAGNNCFGTHVIAIVDNGVDSQIFNNKEN